MPFERRACAAAECEVSPKTRPLKCPAGASNAHTTLPRSSASERVAVESAATASDEEQLRSLRELLLDELGTDGA
jgi:hypothetical protein